MKFTLTVSCHEPLSKETVAFFIKAAIADSIERHGIHVFGDPEVKPARERAPKNAQD